MRMLLVGAAIAVACTSARADTLGADDLARKNEGGYFTGLPLFAYSTDIGLGLGARAYYYWDGDRSDPRFATTPYLYRVFVQAFATTGGVQFHWIDFDAPRIHDTEYRVRSQLILQRATNNNYFGLGNASLAPLSFPDRHARTARTTTTAPRSSCSSTVRPTATITSTTCCARSRSRASSGCS